MITEKFRELCGDKELYKDGWLADLALNDRPKFEAVCAQNHGRLLAAGVDIDFSLQEYIDMLTIFLLHINLTILEFENFAQADSESFSRRRELLVRATLNLSKGRAHLNERQGKIDSIIRQSPNHLSSVVKISSLMIERVFGKGGLQDVVVNGLPVSDNKVLAFRPREE